MFKASPRENAHVIIQRMAPAKINLFLRTRGLRPDGFHNLDTVMIALDLADTLEILPASELTLTSPMGLTLEEDLAGRAALALRGNRDLPGAHLRIDKAIPSGGGLGGGSSNAAAALIALDQYWDLQTPFEQLLSLAASLGSDVPFFLAGQTCIAGGRGEQLRVIPATPLTLYGLLLFPGIPVSTPSAFGWLDNDGLAQDPSGGDRLAPLLRALVSGHAQGVLDNLYNSFTHPVGSRCNPIQRGLDYLAASGLHPLLCGSGSTVIGLSDRLEVCEQAAEAAPYPTQTVRLLNQFPGCAHAAGLPKATPDRA